MSINRETLKLFLYSGKVKSMNGLHAKIYIFDSTVVVTSANLTGMAFSKRYEIAAILTGHEAAEVIELYKHWWELTAAVTLSLSAMPSIKGRKRPPNEEPIDHHLPDLWKLPPDPGGASLASEDSFFDYDQFLECYNDFVQQYYSIQKLWHNSPTYLETDSFLNYLYLIHPNLPSRIYRKRKPPTLSSRQRLNLIRVYASQYQRWLSSGGEDSRNNRIGNSRTIKALLRRNLKKAISPKEIRTIFDQLNCQIPIVKAKLLNNNKPERLRKALRLLLEDDIPIQKRMLDFYQEVDYCGRSTIQELVGFAFPEKYPMRNANSNSGLRMFGYTVAKY